MPTITPFLWFDGHLAEALAFYTELFDDAVTEGVSTGPDGGVYMATLSLHGQRLILLNGGPHYELTPAFSLFVSVEGQDELDHYWDALCKEGEPSRCGWLVDKFGLSWQIVPTCLGQLMGDPDRERADRVTHAMLTMEKLDIAALQAEHDA